MELIPKIEMIGREWNSFSVYPGQGESIVLHAKGWCAAENVNKHAFVQIHAFDARSFDKTVLTPKVDGASWSYTWLPIKSLEADG